MDNGLSDRTHLVKRCLQLEWRLHLANQELATLQQRIKQYQKRLKVERDAARRKAKERA
jgi:hypothetical protein